MEEGVSLSRRKHFDKVLVADVCSLFYTLVLIVNAVNRIRYFSRANAVHRFPDILFLHRFYPK